MGCIGDGHSNNMRASGLTVEAQEEWDTSIAGKAFDIRRSDAGAVSRYRKGEA